MADRNCIIERGFTYKSAFILFFVLGAHVILQAQNWQIIQPTYTTTDAFVAGYSIKDYGATGDGMTDVTAIFQQRIDALGVLGGGTLFIPEGKYVFKGTLILRKGVILRGEWKKPIKGQSITGTILMPYSGRGNESTAAFITMEPSSAVQDIVVWHPEQQPDNVTEYPPTILVGEENYFGNDYCNVKNITLVNSYSGIIYSRVNGGSCPVINGIYGTPLYRGIEIDNISDVGRIENIHFSPAYWEGSGLPGAPGEGSAVEKWMFSNGTGIVMRRNDWSYTCFATIDGYNKGLHIGPSIASPGTSANGHFYSLTFTRCQTGIYFETTSDVGIMFTKIKISSSTNGIAIGPQVKFPIQLHTVDITTTQNALTTDAGSSVKLMMQKSTINGGQVIISGGTLTASDCDFKDPIHKIIIGSNARVALTGNRFVNPSLLQNNSVLNGIVDNTALTLPALPNFKDTLSRNQKPSRLVMYNVLNAPYNAKNDGVTDNTSAIQNALNAASLAGGGVVFLPPGKYKVLGTLIVPTGVELKGAVDVGTAPMGPGSILQVYSGKGNELGTPFIQLSSGSGLRGVVFDYPEQLGNNVPNFLQYPYCIQVTGNNVYIVNVGMRGAYHGIDLFTNTCDNHYLDYVSGSVLKTGVVVGNSTGGNISNLQFNPIGYVYGDETKWGQWSNAPSHDKINAIVNYVKDNLIFLTLNTCSNETLYNDFHYGSQSGLILSGASGISLGMGIDGSRKSLVINSLGASGLDFINSQIVSIDNLPGTCYIETKSGFTSQTTFFNSDYWGWTEYGVSQAGGTLNFQLANFQYPGSTAFANINGGSMTMKNSAVMPATLLLNSGDEPRFSAEASVLDPTGINKLSCALWKNNLSNAPEINPAGVLSRTGWTATASDNNGQAGSGIDGNNVTRWDTGVKQTSGQWYILDMQANQIFNKIVLDAQASTKDFPIGYTVYVSTDGINWTSVGSGAGSSALTVIDIPVQNARYIKIVQTGSSDIFWWSINEYYVLNSSAPEPVNGISIAPTSLKLNISATSQLTGTISPTVAANTAVTWTSDNAAVATVSATGLVTAVSVGSALITVKSVDGDETATSFVTVAVPVSAVSVSPTSLNLTVGDSQQITPTVSPANATFKTVTWDSNNWTVATVSPNGLVTAIAEGSATITVKTSDDNKTATINVSVTNVTAINEINLERLPLVIYPNPVSVDAYFDYDLKNESEVNIIVYNGQGAIVRLENQKSMDGAHQVKVNVDNLSPGMYFVRITSNLFDVTNKIMVIK